MANFEARGNDLYIDNQKVIKAWESFSGWYWFATEKEGTQDSVMAGEVYPNDTIWFGFVQGLEEEWGSWSQAEIEQCAGKIWEIPKKNLPFSGRRS